MSTLLRFVVFGLLFVLSVIPAHAQDSVVRETDYLGNVSGTVRDAATGAPIVGAEILLIENPLGRSRAERGFATPSNKGLVVLPLETINPRRKVYTDAAGEFLMSGVATPFPYKRYTVIATAPGYDATIVDHVAVLPGAVMELQVNFALTQGKNEATVFDRSDEKAPFRYGHGLRGDDIAPPNPENEASSQADTSGVAALAVAPFTRSVFATQEGLVGRTTANGHVIKQGDNFVALPSRRALCSKGGNEFQVMITYKGKTVIAPVWDVGPWNVRDDYWNPVAIREEYFDLPFGVPAAQAAFQNGYNKKQSTAGTVKNPAGIDLGSGTATALGLKSLVSDWATVTYLWTYGNADFSVSAPAGAAVVRGSNTAITVTIASTDGFRAWVTPSFSGLPSNSSATYADSAVQPPLNGKASTTLNVKTTSTTPLGKTTLTVTGTVGRLKRSATISLNVTPPPLSSTSSCAPGAVVAGGSVTVTVTAAGGVPPYQFSVNGQSFGKVQTSATSSATVKPTQSGSIVSTVKDGTGQQSQTSCQVQVYKPLTAACSATPNPVKINSNITWLAQPGGGSGSYTYSWLNGTTTQSYSKTYPTAQTVSNWVIITDKKLSLSQKTTCSLTVKK